MDSAKLEQRISSKLDWVHLPPGAEIVSLWHVLHDAEVVSIRSDLITRKTWMSFDISQVREFHSLPPDTSFTFELSDVSSARVTNGRFGQVKLPN